MSGIQLSGLASGLDWKSLVDKLIEAERLPQKQLQAERNLGTQRSNALTALTTNLTALQTALQAFSSDSGNVFAARSAKFSSASTTWSATAADDAEQGNHTIQVSQLATRTQLAGAADAGRGISASADVSGVSLATLPIAGGVTAGDFTINGARITVALTDSLQDVFDQIATKTSGAVTASYDPVTDKVRLSSATEIVLGSANDSSNFLGALQLYNNGTGDIASPKPLGIVSPGAAIVNANLRVAVTADAGGNGSFSINGIAISYNVNTDSLQSVIARINGSNAGVTASYDRASDRFVLTNKTTGDLGISVSEDPGGLLGALGLGGSATLSRGKNAQFSIDGGETLTSTSNTLDASVHGIAGLTVAVTTEGTEAISVAADTVGIRTKVEEFIAKFNAVQSYIEQQTRTITGSDGKVTTAALTSNHEVTDIAKALRNKVFAAVPGLTGTIQRLESLGIDFRTGTSELEIKDSAKLDAALRDRGADVQTLFASKPDGLAARLNGYLAQVTGSTGVLATQTATLSKNSRRIDEQIAATERRLTQQRELLEQSFIRMEEAQSNIQRQLAALTNAFGNTSSTK